MTTSGTEETAFSKGEILEFINEENLKYQKINLPYGLSTPGHERGQAKHLAFGDSVEGKTVLDIGSYLGSFCVDALEKGAASAVGLELNNEKIMQARQIAKFLGLAPCYIQEDIENYDPGDFDIILCLNILHHLRDPIAVLRKLALRTRETLLIEASGLGRHDIRKLWQGTKGGWVQGRIASLMNGVLSSWPIMGVGTCNPSRQSQTFFFTAIALQRILDGHMRLFQKVDYIPSEFKGRYLLKCTKLKIDRMVLVSGVCSSGKSYFCENIINYSDKMSINNLNEFKLLSPSKLWKNKNFDAFPENKQNNIIFHYDICNIHRYKMHSYSRDPATDLLYCTNQVDIVIIAPNADTLSNQLIDSEGKNGLLSEKHHKIYLKNYSKKGWLRSAYTSWIDFCSKVAPNAKFYIYSEAEKTRSLSESMSADEAIKFINIIYKL